jgi:hypothetical protein
VSIEATFAEQKLREIESRVHNFCSLAGNTLERVGILIDEGEYEEAKEEVEGLREQLSRINGR